MIAPKGKERVLAAIKATGALRVLQWLGRSHPLIFMWHRVASHPTDHGVQAELFERQLELLRTHRTIYRLDELMEKRLSGEPVPPNAAVLTFDDGYGDYYEVAHPILKKHGLPSTVFVTTDFVDRKQWMWPDKIRYILESRRDPVVDLSEMLGSSARFDNELAAWNQAADHCLGLLSSERDEAISQFARVAGVDVPAEPTVRYRSLNWDEIRELQRDGVQIGSHSVTHPFMTRLSPEDLEYELVASRDRISAETGVSPDSFSYPFGTPDVISHRVTEAIRSAGYRYAVVSTPGPRSLESVWTVNRHGVRDSLYEFKKSLFGVKQISLKLSARRGARGGKHLPE
jgi:peptidoglycan/xylan/chitin deacetylase (PgdA/CDA1 family)